MPIAVPMIPPSASGVSITRFSPNSSKRPCVTRKTPPTLPTSSPRITTRSSLRISCLSALLIACTRFISPISVTVSLRGPRAGLTFLLLLAEMPGLLLEDVAEHRLHRGRVLLLGDLDRRLELGVDFLADALVVGVGPRADHVEVLAGAQDRI